MPAFERTSIWDHRITSHSPTLWKRSWMHCTDGVQSDSCVSATLSMRLMPRSLDDPTNARSLPLFEIGVLGFSDMSPVPSHTTTMQGPFTPSLREYQSTGNVLRKSSPHLDKMSWRQRCSIAHGLTTAWRRAQDNWLAEETLHSRRACPR